MCLIKQYYRVSYMIGLLLAGIRRHFRIQDLIFLNKVRSWALNFILTLIYFLVLTPIALVKRSNPKDNLSSWKGKGAIGGWHELRQSTSQREIFRRMM